MDDVEMIDPPEFYTDGWSSLAGNVRNVQRRLQNVKLDTDHSSKLDKPGNFHPGRSPFSSVLDDPSQDVSANRFSQNSQQSISRTVSPEPGTIQEKAATVHNALQPLLFGKASSSSATCSPLQPTSKPHILPSSPRIKQSTKTKKQKTSPKLPHKLQVNVRYKISKPQGHREKPQWPSNVVQLSDSDDESVSTQQDEEVNSDYENPNIDESIAFSNLPFLLEEDDLQITNIIERRPGLATKAFKSKSRRGVWFNYSPGKCVELEDGSFLRITKVVEDLDQNTYLLGHLFLRHNEFEGTKWPRRHNEVVQIVQVKDGRPIIEVKRSLTTAWRNRKLILTNHAFEFTKPKDHRDSFREVQQNKEFGPLVCRWQETRHVNRAGKIVEESIERLSYAEADSELRIQDQQARLQWRGTLIPGGSHTYTAAHVEQDGHKFEKAQKYSFGDTFCGAGGASCGADLANLHVAFGVDLSEKAMESYKKNFAKKGAKCCLEDISAFLSSLLPGEYMVDVLHMSPPCQPFSPAHTVANMANDEINEAAIFAVGELLKKLKPRVATVEETFGLVQRHKEWFDALIKMFIELGYSIRWKIAKLEEYGLAQKRRRLLIIAAGPGETLPKFPEVTHSETNRSLKPLSTIQDALDIMPTRKNSDPHHNVDAAMYSPKYQKRPYSPLNQAHTITTSGGIGNHHPSGKRSFTIRELAVLQKFPLRYEFADVGVTALRRQIGNAVPPYIFKKIYQEIVLSLKKTDGVL